MPSTRIASQGVIEAISIPLAAFCDQDGQCKASNVEAYLGIPFAQPPVGSLRWKRPQRPAPSWAGVRQSAWKCDPMQELMLPEFLVKPRRDLQHDESGESTLSEDCLYLNVWVPQRGREAGPLPVLVWIYGGAFVFGSNSTPGYDGARLCSESDCIVVSISYRVGLFGWMGSKELAQRTGDKGTGNYGAWDVVAALEWVQENIASFGGDSSNVTVFGESAGSILLHLLLLSPETPPNLFARAVLESGTVMTKAARTLPSAQATFDAIVTKLGASASSSDEEKVEKMIEASAETLLTLSSTLPSQRPRTEYRVDEEKGRPVRRMDHDQSKLQIEAQNVYGPVWDGVFIPADYLDTAFQGLPSTLKNGQKGIMVGCCIDEGSIFNLTVQSPQALHRHISSNNPSLIQSMKDLYSVESAQTNPEAFATVSAYTGDELFLVPIRELMLRFSNQTMVPAYGFVFAHRPSKQSLRGLATSEASVQIQSTLGAMHTVDLPFIFGNDGAESHIFERERYPGYQTTTASRSENSHTGFTMEEQKLSLFMMRSFGKFARQEVPWKPLNNGAPVSNVEDCQVLTIGRFASLGANTPASITARDKESGIPIKEQRLGNHLCWTEKVGASASHKDRHAFWSSDNFRRVLINYYGDERIAFIP